MGKELFIGIDIENISRVGKLLNTKSRSLLNFFTENELFLTEVQIAGNFAVKEAVKKALPWIQQINYSEFEVLRDLDGRPYIHSINSEFFKGIEIDVSISNLNDLVIGIAIIRKI